MRGFPDALRRPGRSLVLAALLAAMPQLAAAGSVSWKGWTFDHTVSSYYDGLSLKNVKFQGRTIIDKISLPVMRAFYENNACGPYAERLGGSLSTIPWASNSRLAKREFTLNGQQWYEIGIRDQIGSYDIYFLWWLGRCGFDAVCRVHADDPHPAFAVDHFFYAFEQ